MGEFSSILKIWNDARPLIQQGYQTLNKTLVLGLPATSMPAESIDQDTGIGSPYGKGAERIWHFWDKIIHKIMIGPIGKTDAKTWHSPYLSSWDYNPFFIDLAKLTKKNWLSQKTLQKIYAKTKKEGYIDFKQVQHDYMTALKEAHQKTKSSLNLTQFCNHLVRQQMSQSPFPYIGDIPINIPTRITTHHPDWFLKDWSMGTPPDAYSAQPQKWGFPVLNPTALFSTQGKLGPAGRVFKNLLRFYLSGNKGGVRIDHFIGWVDPYCFYTGKKGYENGRLYSSPNHPILKNYYKDDKEQFKKLTAEFLIPLFKQFHLNNMDIYPEDLGIRPEQMDFVLKSFHLGKMLPVQFNEPNDPNHIYHLTKATAQDIAVLDTHDNPNLLDFFTNLSLDKRQAFAKQLADDLRFNYTDDLCTPTWLYRMQWATALASPAKRIMVFFTTLMGQKGRYNTPNVLDSWHLRCLTNFDLNYFIALKKGEAYNPFEAIYWAIYARDDKFYQRHKSLVQKLKKAEKDLFQALESL